MKKIVETTVGLYELVNNYRDAFDIAKFQERYVKEIYDKYDYIVGDVSSEMLRLKGFYSELKKEQNIKDIQQYLNESCNYNCGYFILKRIKKL
ncbi:MAG: YutD family protein [Acholeplasmataceae bacterium]|jgi:uncharacterized protein YutD|nr:YutD family protein [Acholeplasmataceae bacterium]